MGVWRSQAGGLVQAHPRGLHGERPPGSCPGSSANGIKAASDTSVSRSGRDAGLCLGEADEYHPNRA